MGRKQRCLEMLVFELLSYICGAAVGSASLPTTPQRCHGYQALAAQLCVQRCARMTSYSSSVRRSTAGTMASTIFIDPQKQISSLKSLCVTGFTTHTYAQTHTQRAKRSGREVTHATHTTPIRINISSTCDLPPFFSPTGLEECGCTTSDQADITMCRNCLAAVNYCWCGNMRKHTHTHTK